MARYSNAELKEIGLKSYGKNVLISKDARIYSPHKITMGDNVIIDDFCIISGEVTLGSNVHLCPNVQLAAGAGKIVLKDFVGISFNVVITASSDDYSGRSIIGPTVPNTYKKTKTIGKVIIGKHVVIGASCVILPNIEIGDGAAVGAMSFVTKDLKSWGIYAGIPVKKINERSKKLIELEEEYKASLK